MHEFFQFEKSYHYERHAISGGSHNLVRFVFVWMSVMSVYKLISEMSK